VYTINNSGQPFDADPAFFLIIGGANLIYTFVTLGVIALLEWAVRRLAKA
jgi:hypothetical protein